MSSVWKGLARSSVVASKCWAQVQLREWVADVDSSMLALKENRLRRREVQERMKKKLLLFLLLPFLAVASHAQESRQDVSVSVTGIFQPFIVGNDVQQSSTDGLGGLVSYRYMLTPRSGLEANYQYAQNTQKYYTSFNNVRVHDRMQEFSVAYVLNANFKNWNPFIEGGPAAFMFTPLDDAGTNQLDVKGQTILGAMYGGGVAYELSPSFDIRAEYRGLLMKTPDFGLAPQKTGRFYNVYNPVIGIAYHF
jgi:outer membrane immunogenic protein